MADAGDKYVFDIRSLWEVYKRRSSNALVDAFSQLLKDKRLFFHHTSLRDIGEIDEPAKEYLNGVDNLSNGRINAPDEVYAIASSYEYAEELKRIDPNDRWSMAVAQHFQGVFVVAGADARAKKLRECAKSNGLKAITFEEFVKLFV